MMYKQLLHLILACNMATHVYCMTQALTQATTAAQERNAKLIAAMQMPCQHVAFRITQELIRKGADVNTKDVDGNTPLMLAARNKHEDLAVLLCKYGAQTDVSNNKGESFWEIALTPLIRAIKHEQAQREVRGTLQKFMQQCCILVHKEKLPTEGEHRALEALVCKLASKELPINIQDELGCTPLHYAAELGNQTLVNWCLENHASVTIQDEHGQTALMKAAQGGHDKIVNALLRYDSSTRDQCDSQNWNALTHAAAYKQLKTMELLAHYGTTREKDKFERTVEEIAKDYGHDISSETASLRTSPVSDLCDPVALTSDTDEGY